jgi:hypothetical protein
MWLVNLALNPRLFHRLSANDALRSRLFAILYDFVNDHLA